MFKFYNVNITTLLQTGCQFITIASHLTFIFIKMLKKQAVF